MSTGRASARSTAGTVPAPGSAVRRVWLLGLTIAAVALCLQVTAVSRLGRLGDGPRAPWWAVALLFAVAEAMVVHMQFRREAHSFSLNEVPLAIGLFMLSADELILAQLVGATLALGVRRRQPPMKLVFNLAQLTLAAQLATLVLRAFTAFADPFGPAGWAGTLVGVTVAGLVGAVAVSAAIFLTEGWREREVFPKATLLALGVGAGSAAVGLLAVELLRVEPIALLLLAVPAFVVQLIYRQYAAQLHQLASLKFLYEATRTAQRSIRVEDVISAILDHARSMFRADLGEIVFLPSDGDGHAVRTTLGPGPQVRAMEPLELDPSEGVWARIMSEGEALLLPRPIEPARLREHFERRGILDAMVAPLVADGEVIGTMMIANRHNEVSTFDAADFRLFETLANHAGVSLQNARLVRQLEDSLAHLTEMNRLKDDFVATVSHELRTPLTSVQGTIKTLLRAKSKIDAETEASLLQAADRQSDRLRQLIENLLIVGRIESRQVSSAVDEVEVPGVVERVLEEIAGPDAARVRVSLDPRLPRIQTDGGKFHQILTNLVDNALKYSPPGSPVALRAVSRVDGVEVSVEDRGGGIPEDLRDRVFDRFFQVDQSSTRQVGGTGLGLYICRQLAEALGGRLWLERSEASGSVFSLWLPLRPVDAPAEEVRLPA